MSSRAAEGSWRGGTCGEEAGKREDQELGGRTFPWKKVYTTEKRVCSCGNC